MAGPVGLDWNSNENDREWVLNFIGFSGFPLIIALVRLGAFDFPLAPDERGLFIAGEVLCGVGSAVFLGLAARLEYKRRQIPGRLAQIEGELEMIWD